MTAPALRPLSLGEILDVSFGLYRNLFFPLLIVTLVTRAVPLAISAYLEQAGGVVVNPLLYVLSLILDMVLGAIATAASTFIVSESYMGRRLSAGEAFGRAAPFIGRLILLGILTSFVVVLGLFLFFIPGVILACGLALATPAMVIEGQPSATAAMGRSWALTKGSRFKLFGALIVVGILIYLPFVALGAIAAMSVGGTPASAGPAGMTGFLGLTSAAALLSSLVWPLFYCTLTVAYYDLRVRKEAFDLELLSAGLAQA
jgi:hypothetical protein